jgi:hypothetical protein
LNGTAGEFLNKVEYFLLLLMILSKNMVIQYGTLILIFIILALSFHAVASFGNFIALPEVEFLVFEKLFAVFFHAHCLGCIRIAPIIIYDLIKLLLEFKSNSVHLLHTFDLRLWFTEVLININVAIADILFLEW